jgi:hypothetical protein
MLKVLLALVAVPGAILALATATAAQTFPPNLPAAIICYVPQNKTWRVGYLSRVYSDGNAIFLTPDGRAGATVNAKGLVMSPDGATGVDCFGKTLDELRANGRVLDFQRGRPQSN